MERLRRFSDRFVVSERSQVGEARRYALAVAAELHFSSTQQGRVGIVTTELASNLAKHSQGGEFIVQEIRCGKLQGIELLAIDSGPGISDLGKVMSDGYSTAGSPGTGLGAVRRLSHTFDLYSQAGHGSVFGARLWPQEKCEMTEEFECGVISVPRPGENANGDSWWVDEPHAGKQAVMVADGLGHGEFAAQAADEAVLAFRKVPNKEPEALLAFAHDALRKTRGAAMSVALIDAGQQRVEYAGIGNIAAGIASDDGVRRLVSYDGTLGHSVRKIQKYTYPWRSEALLIMHSDGLSANWNLEQYPGLLRRHAMVIAGVLYRDHRRKNDDATVLVLREQDAAQQK